MKNQADTQKTVVQEKTGLRFIGFEELEGQEVTIKRFPAGRLVIQPGKATDTAAPHVAAIIRDGFAQGKELLEFIQQAFRGKRSMVFLATPTPLQDGTSRIDYYQMS